MTNEETIKQGLEIQFKNKVEVTIQRERRMFSKVAKEDLVAVIKFMKERFGFTHLTTISSLDLGETLEALYHLFNGSVELTVRTQVLKKEPVIPTLTGVIAGSVLYERELQDMMGFKVKDHPDPRRFNLPEDWPEGVYPLRKDYKPNAN
jgi:Ni,Fe-hydrogenase III component G